MNIFRLDLIDQTILGLLSCAQGLSTANISKYINLSTKSTRKRLLKLIKYNLVREKGSSIKDPTRKYFLVSLQENFLEENFSPKNHQAIEFNTQTYSKISEIFNPLENMGITTFVYQNFINDKQYFPVANNINWIKYHLNNMCDFNKTFQQKIFLSEKDIHTFWPSKPIDPLLTSFYSFNIWNGIMIVNRSTKSSSIEAFSFATNYENTDIINFYISNFQRLKEFILFFKKKILDDKDELILSKSITLKNPLLFKDSLNTFEKIRRPDNFVLSTISTNSGPINISCRENECLLYLSKGQSFKEIASNLNISSRTVESHLSNIKNKLNCYSKSQIIDLYLRSKNDLLV